jgi:hypothetical protein
MSYMGWLSNSFLTVRPIYDDEIAQFGGTSKTQGCDCGLDGYLEIGEYIRIWTFFTYPISRSKSQREVIDSYVGITCL